MARFTSGLRPLAIFLAFLVVGATGAGAILMAADDHPQRIPVLSLGPTYTEAVVGTWQNLDPLLAESAVDKDLVALVFRGLVKLGPDGSLQPALADLPATDEGGRTLTFRLKEGLRWSDGETLNAEDVAFTIGLIQAPDFRGNPLLAEAWSGVKVSTPDPLTVVITLPHPNAPFLARFGTIGILPAHVFDASSPSRGEQDALAVGSGPYRIASLDSQEAHLVANPYFAGDPPRIVDLRLRFYPDQPAALRALLEGEADGFLTLTSPRGDLLAEVEASGEFSLITLQRSLAIVLYLNNDNALFEEPAVRRALALLIDRSSLPWGPGGSGALPSGSPIVPGSWAYAPEFDITARSPEEASILLDKAGWHTHGTTGNLTREGSEFRLTIRTDDDPLHVALATAVADQLGAVGIRANVASTSLNVLVRDFLQERKYDAAIVTWEQGPDPDPYYAWHSSQLGSAGLNLANFADPVADELIALGRTHLETAVRLDAYRQFQARWLEMTPSIVLGYPTVTYIIRRDIEPSLPAVLFKPEQRLTDIEHWER